MKHYPLTYLNSDTLSPGRDILPHHILNELPEKPWINTTIAGWMPGDDNLPVEYAWYKTPFGKTLISNTPEGVCYLGIMDKDRGFVADDFLKRFGYAHPVAVETELQQTALGYLYGETNEPLPLHLRGTPYQTGIWRRLIRIPYGKVISYATLAGSSRYARTAGTANGRNPIFYLVPCHRAVYSNGKTDRYFWDKDIKRRLLAWEFSNSK